MPDILPPHNVQAEEAVIASALIDAAQWVVGNIPRAAYYSERHAHAHDAIAELVRGHAPVGIVEVADRLRAKGLFGEVGGMDYFKSVMASVAVSDHVAHYGQIVLRAWHERRVQRGAARLTEAVQAGNDDDRGAALDAIHSACRDWDALGVAAPTFREAIHETLSELESKPPRNIKLGLCLDEILATQPGHVVTIAARTSFGKSATALSVALNMAKSGERVAYYSTEMTRKQVVVRALAAESGVENWRIAKRAGVDWQKVNAAAARLAELPIAICPDSHPTLGEIRAFADAHEATVIIVDYLTRCGLPRAENMRLMVSAMMQGLKGMALETDRLVVVCVQVNRAADRQDNRAGLADLKESSAIEEESDAVVILSMTDEQRGNPGVADLTANVLKNRHGRLGEFVLAFDKPHQHVRDKDAEISNPPHPALPMEDNDATSFA